MLIQLLFTTGSGVFCFCSNPGGGLRRRLLGFLKGCSSPLHPLLPKPASAVIGWLGPQKYSVLNIERWASKVSRFFPRHYILQLSAWVDFFQGSPKSDDRHCAWSNSLQRPAYWQGISRSCYHAKKCSPRRLATFISLNYAFVKKFCYLTLLVLYLEPWWARSSFGLALLAGDACGIADTYLCILSYVFITLLHSCRKHTF